MFTVHFHPPPNTPCRAQYNTGKVLPHNNRSAHLNIDNINNIMVFSTAIAFMGDNAKQIDAQEYEQKMREDHPQLLQHDENIVFAFKGRGGKGRDSSMFTTKRLLIRDKRGMTGKRVRYVSVPYKSIRAFCVETNGSLDTDQELKIYARGIGKLSMDFVNNVNVIAIHRFLSAVVIQGKGAGADAAGGSFVHDGCVNMAGDTGFLDLMGSNYSQIDKHQMEETLKRSSILLDDEQVELAFQCNRDSFIMTSKRILKIDVQGITGKKVEYLTILWPAIKGFSGDYSIVHSMYTLPLSSLTYRIIPCL